MLYLILSVVFLTVIFCEYQLTNLTVVSVSTVLHIAAFTTLSFVVARQLDSDYANSGVFATCTGAYFLYRLVEFDIRIARFVTNDR